MGTKLGNEPARSVWGVGPRPAADATIPPATTSALRCSTTKQSIAFAPASAGIPKAPAEVPDFLTFTDDAPTADEVPELISFTEDKSAAHPMTHGPHAQALRPDFFSEFGL